MAQKESEMKKCEHQDLEYKDRDVSGESIYEEYKCQECGVTVTFYYETPDKKMVEYPSGDTEKLDSK